MAETREALLAQTFVTLADSLVADYDVIDVLQVLVDRTLTLFDASAAGITLGSDEQHLDVVASTSEQCRQVELTELRMEEGPCLDAVRSGQVMSVATVPEIEARWPRFADAMGEMSYQSAHAIPLRLRNQTIGSLNLFGDAEGRLNEADAISAQALADVATIGILQDRAISDSTIIQGQLQRALDSRVLIEQAKGILSTTHGINMDEAYRILRHHARSGQAKISVVAEAVIAGDLQVGLQRPLADRR